MPLFLVIIKSIQSLHVLRAKCLVFNILRKTIAHWKLETDYCLWNSSVTMKYLKFLSRSIPIFLPKKTKGRILQHIDCI